MNEQIQNEVQNLIAIRQKMETDPDDIHFIEYIMGLNNIESILGRARMNNIALDRSNKNSAVPRCGIGIDLEKI